MPPRWKSPFAARGRPAPLPAILCLVLLALITSCGGNDDSNRNQIIPISAGITIDPPSGDGVWLDVVGTSGDLITIDVMLRVSTALEFDQFDLFFRFDPLVLQFAGQMQVPESDGMTFNPFGECGTTSTYCGKYPAGGTCDSGTLLCTFPPDSIGNTCTQDSDCEQPPTSGPVNCQIPSTVPGEVYLSLIGDINSSGVGTGGRCDTYVIPAPPPQPVDIRLLRVAFNVTSTTAGTRLELISGGSTTGDCAILRNFSDLGLPCDDGMATITGTR